MTPDRPIAPEIRVAHTADLDGATRSAARAMLFEVFDDMTEHGWDHSLGGMHAIATIGGEVVGHAAVIQRRIGYQGRPLRAGYVEGVGVRADMRRLGIGAALMAPLEGIIRAAYDVGALGATDKAASFYRHRGWLPWSGRSYGLTLEGLVRTPEDDGGIYVLPVRDTPLELTADLIADWRDDSAW